MPSDRDAAFEGVLDELSDGIWRATAGYAADEADRQDLYQDILVALWQALPGFRRQSSLRTFVYRIVHNRGLSHRAYEARRTHADIAGLHVPDQRPGPDELTEQGAQRDELLGAVRALPRRLRQPLMLHLEGLDNAEIAEVVGISKGNVAVRLTRARQAVERAMKSEERR